MFFAVFLNYCQKIGKSPTAVVEEIGLNRSAITNWRKGTNPSNANLLKLANYFGISVSDLTGKKEPAGQMADGNVEEAARLFSKLTPQEQEFFLSQLHGVVDPREK